MSDKILTIKKSTLVDIADQVRAKTGSTDKIKVSDLDDAVAELQGGGGVFIEVDELPEPTVPVPGTQAVVPNTGYVEKVYFNTSLSDEEVMTELEKLTYPSDAEAILVVGSPLVRVSALDLITACYISGTNNETGEPITVAWLWNSKKVMEIMQAGGTNQDALPYVYWISSSYNDLPLGPADFVGWNPNFNGEIEINSDVTSAVDEYSESLGSFPVGEYNDKIVNLFYTCEMGPNPEFNAEATYRLPDETYWVYQNDMWFRFIPGMEEYFKYTKNARTVMPLNNGFPGSIERSGFTIAPYFNTSAVTDMDHMFYNSTDLEYVPLYDTSNVTDMNSMFYQCSSLTSLPSFDTSKVTDASAMFYGCTALVEVPSFKLANDLRSVQNMFGGCTSLNSIPEMNTSKVTSMRMMFSNCKSLTEVSSLDTSNVGDMYGIFSNCESLTKVIFNDTSALNELKSAFINCSSLETVEGLNLASLYYSSSADQAFSGCTSLKNLTIINIKKNLTVGGSNYGTLLTVDSLVGLCKECIKQSSSCELTVGATNLEKLADVYVKFTDSAQTEIPEGTKGYVEVCESTDEGAMTITDYMALKSWTLA